MWIAKVGKIFVMARRGSEKYHFSSAVECNPLGIARVVIGDE